MARSISASGRSDPKLLPRIMCCIASDLRRRRLTSALRDHAELSWHESFAALRAAVETTLRVLVVIVDVEDGTGAAAQAFAPTMRESFRGIGVVAYVKNGRGNSADLCALGAAGVHDLLIEGRTDEGFGVRQQIMQASRHGAAEMVLDELRRILPGRLIPFAAAVVRNPEKSSIVAIAQHMGVHRQTPNVWCRKERYLRPEELLVWCRMLLAAALLDVSGRTLESVANELEYSSPTSLRNLLKKYTGLTATQIREVGFARLIQTFAGRVEQVRGGYGGLPQPPGDRRASATSGG